MKRWRTLFGRRKTPSAKRSGSAAPTDRASPWWGWFGRRASSGLDVPMRRQFFRPYMQAGWPMMNVVVRTIATPATFTAPVKKALADVLPDRPVSGVRHHGRRCPRFHRLAPLPHAAAQRVLGAGTGAGGGRDRRRGGPFGVRSGPMKSAFAWRSAPRTMDVLRLMVNGSMAWVLAGLAAGAAGSAGLTRLLAGDAVTMCARSIQWCWAESRCCWQRWHWPPATCRRAGRHIDPIAALRCD